MNYTFCDGCPCRNSDYEQGSSCNLDYDADYRQLKVDGEWHECSTNCELDHILHGGVDFRPRQCDTEEIPQPPPAPMPPHLLKQIRSRSMKRDIFESLQKMDVKPSGDMPDAIRIKVKE